MIVNSQKIENNWILISASGETTCPECENSIRLLTNTLNGVEEADLDDIKKQLKDFPTKIIYGVCPVCGMEYMSHLVADQLCIEPSEEEK